MNVDWPGEASGKALKHARLFFFTEIQTDPMIPSCFESQLDVDCVGPALALAQVAAVQPCSAVFSDDLDHIGSLIYRLPLWAPNWIPTFPQLCFDCTGLWEGVREWGCGWAGPAECDTQAIPKCDLEGKAMVAWCCLHIFVNSLHSRMSKVHNVESWKEQNLMQIPLWTRPAASSPVLAHSQQRTQQQWSGVSCCADTRRLWRVEH